MNYFDIIIALIFLYSAYRGFSKGIILQAASLAALLLGVFAAIRFSDYTASFLIEKFDIKTQYLPLISFALTFILVVIAVHLIGKLVNKLAEAVALGFVNRILGLTFSLIKTAFIISIVFVIINNANKKSGFLPEKQIEDSILYKPLSNFAPLIFPYLKFDDIENTLKEKIKSEQINSGIDI